MNNQIVIEYIKCIYLEYSIYDDWIYVLDKFFVSFFFKLGFNYYEYYIIDSVMVNGYWSYQLKFKFKCKQEFIFYGDFWVVDFIFVVQCVNMWMIFDVNINLVSCIIIYEEYELRGEVFNWVLVKKKMVVDFFFVENVFGMIVWWIEIFKDICFNQVGIKQDYIEKEEFYLFDEVKVENDFFWQVVCYELFFKMEQQVYIMVDSIQNMFLFKIYVEVLEIVFVGYL